jgi:hypothetical protein
VTRVFWSHRDGEDCLRIEGVGESVTVEVRPYSAPAIEGLPSMAGRLVRDDGSADFVPRFAFAEGTPYSVVVGGVDVAVLTRPRPDVQATTEVIGIFPTSTEVPRNLLRLYIWFSAQMSEGYVADHVRIVDVGGHEMVGVLLPSEHELWDGGRRRLTVLLDPARIKRGLVSHHEVGYPLAPGTSFRLVVDDTFCDARGIPLRGGAERHYEVGALERRRVEPDRWALTVPSSHTKEALSVAFERPLDHGLLTRCLRVTDRGGQLVDGAPEVAPEERSWRFTPREPWVARPHALVIDPLLEDLAGNSLSRVFDRDLTDAEDEPVEPVPRTIEFCPR